MEEWIMSRWQIHYMTSRVASDMAKTWRHIDITDRWLTHIRDAAQSGSRLSHVDRLVTYNEACCVRRSRLITDALFPPRRERKRTGTSLNPCLVSGSKVPTSRRAPKAHRLASKTQQRQCARWSVTNVLSFEQNTPQPTSLSILLEV